MNKNIIKMASVHLAKEIPGFRESIIKRASANLEKKKNHIHRNRGVESAFFYALGLLLVSVIYVSVTPDIALADTANTSSIDTFTDFLFTWGTKIGGIVAALGGIQFALAFRNEDPDGKVRGLYTLVAGFMVVGICLSPTIFGL